MATQVLPPAFYPPVAIQQVPVLQPCSRRTERYQWKSARVIGALQIVGGILIMLFTVGIVIPAWHETMPVPMLGKAFLTFILLVITGGIGIGAAKRKTSCLINAHMVMCILACLCVFGLIIMSAVSVKMAAHGGRHRDHHGGRSSGGRGSHGGSSSHGSHHGSHHDWEMDDEGFGDEGHEKMDMIRGELGLADTESGDIDPEMSVDLEEEVEEEVEDVMGKMEGLFGERTGTEEEDAEPMPFEDDTAQQRKRRQADPMPSDMDDPSWWPDDISYYDDSHDYDSMDGMDEDGMKPRGRGDGTHRRGGHEGSHDDEEWTDEDWGELFGGDRGDRKGSRDGELTDADRGDRKGRRDGKRTDGDGVEQPRPPQEDADEIEEEMSREILEGREAEEEWEDGEEWGTWEEDSEYYDDMPRSAKWCARSYKPKRRQQMSIGFSVVVMLLAIMQFILAVCGSALACKVSCCAPRSSPVSPDVKYIQKTAPLGPVVVVAEEPIHPKQLEAMGQYMEFHGQTPEPNTPHAKEAEAFGAVAPLDPRFLEPSSPPPPY